MPKRTNDEEVNRSSDASDASEETSTVTTGAVETEPVPDAVAGQRITRRTVDRTTTKEHIEETVTEAVPLWAPNRSSYPAPVG